MKTRIKIFIILFSSIFILLGTTSGIVLYYYFQPSAVKSFLEKSLPESFGAYLNVSELYYSIKPLNIRAKGVSLRPKGKSQNYFLNITDLSADLSLEGRFGHKTLIVESLKVNGLSSQIAPGANLGTERYRAKGSSYLSGIAKRLFHFLFFRDVEIRRVEIKDGTITAKSGNGLAELKGINAYLNDDRKIEMSFGISVDLPSEKTSFIANKISITTDRAIKFIDPEIRCTMKVQKATFRSPDADVKALDLYSEVIYNHKHRNLAFDSANLNLRGTTLKLKQEKSSPLDIDVTAGIIFDLIKKRGTLKLFNVEIEDVLLLKALGNGSFGADPFIEIDLSECTVSPQQLRHLIPLPKKEIIDPFSISGKVSFKGDVQGNKAGEKWAWNVNLIAGLNDNSLSYTKEGLLLESLINADFRAAGQLPDLKISAGIKADNAVLSAEGIELKPFKISLTLYGKVPEFVLSDFSANIPESYITIGNKRYPINDVQFYFKNGSFNWKNRSFLIPGIEINSSLLKNLNISLESDGKSTDLRLQGKDINLTQSAIALELLPPGWEFKGTDFIQVDAVLKQNGRLNFSSDLEFKKYSLQNQDSSCIGENLSAAVKANGEMDLQKLHLNGNAVMDIREGEILYDVFYLDLNKSSFFSSCKAEYDISQKSLSFNKTSLGLKGILSAEGHGMVLKRPEGLNISFAVSVPETNLKPGFNAFVLEPFKSEKPFLNDFKIDGRVSADLILNKTEGKFELLGHFLLQDAIFSSHDEGVSLDGVNLDLPMHYQSGQTVPDEIPGKGKLKVDKMDIPWLP
ncbi:MAG TPA: hypothetical protein PLQ82_11830, partial [Desulfobacteraceae bacterium]|nr:hypothetical protein [Desulfobacteraceae bacterium]